MTIEQLVYQHGGVRAVARLVTERLPDGEAVSKSTVSRWCRDNTIPSTSHAVAFSALVGVSVQELVGMAEG